MKRTDPSWLLLVVFGVSGLLAYEAWCVARDRRLAGERALRDVATFSTWGAARRQEASLHLALSTVFQRVSGRTAPGEELLPPVRALEHGASYARSCRCAPVLPARYYFRLDLRHGTLLTTSPAQPINAASWLADSVRKAVGRYRFPYAIAFGGRAHDSEAIAYTFRHDSSGKAVGAYGMVIRADSLGISALPEIEVRKSIVPVSLRGAVTSDSIISFELLGPGGVVFTTALDASTPVALGAISDTTPLAAWTGGMRARVTLRPEAALLIDRAVVSSSRVTLWIALLILTAGLVLLAMRQIRREQELTRMRAEFATNVSHELRTPLAQILLFGETLTLKRVRSDHERDAAAEVIVREARRLMRMVENALHFARSGRTSHDLSREHVPLAPVVRSVLSDFAPLAFAADARIRDELHEDVAAPVDRAAIRQILLNLLDNAIKYGPRGQEIIVSVTNGATARLAVEDEGPGVAAADRDRIWDPFVRLPNSGTEAGSGIGLSVVRDLARRHGGEAWVEDRARDGVIGRGAKFVVAFPLRA